MSNKVLMIGAGGVATVCAFKIAQNTDVFGEFMIASHHREKCVKLVDAIHAKGYKMPIETAEVDADSVDLLKELFNSYKPDLVINLALLSGPEHHGGMPCLWMQLPRHGQL